MNIQRKPVDYNVVIPYCIPWPKWSDNRDTPHLLSSWIWEQGSICHTSSFQLLSSGVWYTSMPQSSMGKGNISLDSQCKEGAWGSVLLENTLKRSANYQYSSGRSCMGRCILQSIMGGVDLAYLKPKIFTPTLTCCTRVRREMRADAGCVNLRECSHFYYELGLNLHKL